MNIADIVVDTVKELTGSEISGDTLVSCPHTEYFGKIQSLLDETDPKDVLNYLLLRHILDLVPATTAEMRMFQLEFNSIRTGITVPPAR